MASRTATPITPPARDRSPIHPPGAPYTQRATALRAVLAAAIVVTGAACRTPAPVAAPTTTPPTAAASPATGAAADVRFVQHMIAHHAQAMVMTALVPERTRRDETRLLAERIATSQRDEMRAMQQWLRARGAEVPAVDTSAHAAHSGHAGHGAPGAADAHAGMPGMLSAAELARLASASGPAFDRLFLEYMIRHHEGALTMVAELFAAPGGAQESEVYRLASDVDADQRAEIRRMRALLATLP